MKLFSNIKKMYHLNRWNETGRSMTEMLGVLAVIGILTIGGTTVIRYALQVQAENATANAFTVAIVGARTGELIDTTECDNINGCIINPKRIISIPNEEMDERYFTTKTLSPVETRLYNYADDATSTIIQGFYVGIAGISEKICELLQYSKFNETCAYIAPAGSSFSFAACNSKLAEVDCAMFANETGSRKSELQEAGLQISFAEASASYPILYVFFSEEDSTIAPYKPEPPLETDPDIIVTDSTDPDLPVDPEEDYCIGNTPFARETNRLYIEHFETCNHWNCDENIMSCGSSSVKPECYNRYTNSEPRTLSRFCCENSAFGVWLTIGDNSLASYTRTDSFYAHLNSGTVAEDTVEPIGDCCIQPGRKRHTTYKSKKSSKDTDWSSEAGGEQVNSIVHNQPTRVCCEGWTDDSGRSKYRYLPDEKKCCEVLYDGSDTTGTLTGNDWQGNADTDCGGICTSDCTDKTSPTILNGTCCCSDATDSESGIPTTNCCAGAKSPISGELTKFCCENNAGGELKEISSSVSICCKDGNDVMTNTPNPMCTGTCTNLCPDDNMPVGSNCCCSDAIDSNTGAQNTACCNSYEDSVSGIPTQFCCDQNSETSWAGGKADGVCCASDGKDVWGNEDARCQTPKCPSDCSEAGWPSHKPKENNGACCCSDSIDAITGEQNPSCCITGTNKDIFYDAPTEYCCRNLPEGTAFWGGQVCCIPGKAIPMGSETPFEECCSQVTSASWIIQDRYENGICCIGNQDVDGQNSDACPSDCVDANGGVMTCSNGENAISFNGSCCCSDAVDASTNQASGSCCSTDIPGRDAFGQFVSSCCSTAGGTLIGSGESALCCNISKGTDTAGVFENACCEAAGGKQLRVGGTSDVCCINGLDATSGFYNKACCETGANGSWQESAGLGYCCIKGSAKPIGSSIRTKECCEYNGGELLSDGTCCKTMCTNP